MGALHLLWKKDNVGYYRDIQRVVNWHHELFTWRLKLFI